MKKLNNVDNICFNYKKTVLQAMEAINSKSLPYLIIVNNKSQLLGTITDGDIRRHILKGNSLNQTIDIAMNKKPVFCYESQHKLHQKKLLSIESIKKFLPIVNNNKKILYILLHEKEEEDNIALIMAGGFGKRLGKKTLNTPKPMLKIGKKVVLDIILKKIYKSKFKKIYISTHYLHNKIEKHIESKHKNKNITLINEKKPMGTAGCISLIGENFKNLVVINGDVISNIDLDALMSFHYETKNDITLSVAKYSYKVPFGLIELDKMHRLKNIKEKPLLDYNVVSGIYCLKKSICNLINQEYLDMTTLIENSMNIKKKIGVFPIYEYWQDIGNPDDLIKAKTEYIK